MRKQEIETRIAEIAREPDNFDVKLHFHLEFDEEKYIELFDLLKTYVELTCQDTHIHREVYATFYALEVVLLGVLNHLEHLNEPGPFGKKHPLWQRCQDAHADVQDYFIQLINSAQ